MSRILKRPMFRTGGSTNEGIMTGLVNRKGYQQGTYKERALEALRTDAPRDTSMYEMLIGGGLNLVSGAGAGEGLMANVARSYKGPSEDYFKAQRAAREYDRKLEQTAGQIGLEQEFKMEQIKAKDSPQSALYNVYLQQGVEQGMSGAEAQRFATYHTDIQDKLRRKVGGNLLGGLIEFDLNDQKQVNKQLPKLKKKIGHYFYDPYDGKIKRLVERGGKLDFQIFNSVEEIDLTPDPGISTETSTPYADEQAAIEQEKSEGLLTDEDVAGIRFP